MIYLDNFQCTLFGIHMWILLNCTHLLFINCIAPLYSSQMMHWSSCISLSIWRNCTRLHKHIQTFKAIMLKGDVYKWCKYYHFKRLARQIVKQGKIVLISSTWFFWNTFNLYHYCHHYHHGCNYLCNLHPLLWLWSWWQLLLWHSLKQIPLKFANFSCLAEFKPKKRQKNYLVLCKEREEVVGDWAWFIDEPQAGRRLPLSSGLSFSCGNWKEKKTILCAVHLPFYPMLKKPGFLSLSVYLGYSV